MNCRDVREMPDSLLCEPPQSEMNPEMARHLETCALCRTELEARWRLRAAVRGAFDRTPELQPSAEFRNRLRRQLREESFARRRPWVRSNRWVALAAAIVLAVSMAGVIYMKRSGTPAEALAGDAIGDHQNCALKYRLVREPVPLVEAAERFDTAYRLLLTAPPDSVSTPNGPARVTERHSCAYGARRFGHVIMEYRGHVVSLLLTATDQGASHAGPPELPQPIGRPINGLSAVSVDGIRHAILMVSDLDRSELVQLSHAVSVPLLRRVEASLTPTQDGLASWQPEPRFQIFGSDDRPFPRPNLIPAHYQYFP